MASPLSWSVPIVLSLLCGSASSAPQYSSSPRGGALSLGVGGGSDSCSSPQAIAGTGNYAFDNSAATASSIGQSESLCGFFGSTQIDNDVWFAWTADFDGTASFSTCNSTTLDTKLAVYPGASCPAVDTALACNDDACALQSELEFAVSNGTTYLLQVGSFPGTGGGVGQFFVGERPSQPCAIPHDSGSETSLGLTFGGDTLALVYIDCLQSIDTIEVAYGTPGSPGGIPLGSAVELGIWDDPTDDSDASDALLMHRLPIPVGVQNPDLDQFTSYDLTVLLGNSVQLSGGAFVGVVVTHGGNQWPFALDQTSSQLGRNWIAGATTAGSFDFADLAANPLPPQTVESINFPGHWLLHVTGADLPVEPGSAYCFCDGGNAPCANSGASGNGCANGSNPAGAKLEGSGQADVLADTLVLTASGLVPGQPGLFFQGTTEILGGVGDPFGDGLRCAGGAVQRLEVSSAGAGGSSTTTLSISVAGAVSAGELHTYQLWYRDPAGSPCGAQFNLTNGYRVQW